MHHKPCLPLLFLSFSAALACGGPSEPVARLEIEPRSPVLPWPGSVELRSSWETTRPLAGLQGDPYVFVHLLDAEGGIVRTFDHRLPFDWQPGATESYAVELWQSALAEPVPPGSYRLSVGVYDLAKHRWPLIVDGEEVDDQEYVVATVEVPAVDAAAPSAAFGDGWLPVEPGAGRQVLAVRWLTEDGAVELRGVAEPTTVDLTLSVKRLEEAGFHLVLDEGTEAPAVALRSDCLPGGERTLSGYGSHDVELALAPAEGSSTCRVEIDPGFVFLHRTDFSKRSVVLERLLWHP